MSILGNKAGLSPNSLIFILGCQRSGTTWLANIMDCSSELLLFVEPFSVSYNILPGFPEPSYFLEQSSTYLDQLLKNELPARLIRHKALFSQRAVWSPAWFVGERWLSEVGRKQQRFLPSRIKRNLRNFQLLNLNRMDDTFPLYAKSRKPSIWAIKELRLAGKIPVLLSAFPESRFLVIIRHPMATVNSILFWFQRGRLGELRRELETYLVKIEVQSVAVPYRQLIARCREATLAHQVALYWRISYETLFNKLDGHPNACFLVYEQLSSQPRETVKQIFDKFDMPWSTNVADYLSLSSQSTPMEITPITTVRESAKYYLAWRDQISEDTRQAVIEMTAGSFLLPLFEPFYDEEFDVD